MAPSVTAQIFWLKNRKYVEWRDRIDTKIEATVESENPFKQLTTEELKELVKRGSD